MGYSNPPWRFDGRALYQLQLVKSEDAKKYIPPQCRLVELFGYTLGGFYIARYEDSPVGAFNELVVMAGLVWNAPTSCAWAARVYVDNKEARDHGLSTVGLPSRQAQFSAATPFAEPESRQNRNQKKRQFHWWSGQLSEASKPSGETYTTVQITNSDKRRGRGLKAPVCILRFPTFRQMTGPRININLPSFSGATADHPELLHYRCMLSTNVRFTPPVCVLFGSEKEDTTSTNAEEIRSLLTGRPLVTIGFDDMKMIVPKPTVISLPTPVAVNTNRPYALAASTVRGAAVNSVPSSNSSGQNIAVVLATLPWRFGTTL